MDTARSLVAALSSTFLLALLACGNGPRAPGVVTDSAGVVIIESEVGAKGEWALVSNPSLEIASASDDSSEPLYRVVGLARLGDHTVVANGGTNQIFFYDSAGNRVRSIGREGGGPGEFERLSAIFWKHGRCFRRCSQLCAR